MTSPFKIFHFLPTPGRGLSTVAAPAALVTVLVATGALSSVAHGALPSAGPPPSGTVTLPAVPTTPTTAGVTGRRGVLPVHRLPARGALGTFAHVTLPGRVVTVGPVTKTTASAPPPAVPAAAGQDEKPFVVMIDPGHGGSDQGATAFNGLLEKDLTRDIAERVRLYLSEIDGITVLMTREGDEGLSRRLRVARVRDSGADLVLSLHFNHLPQQEVTLVESFYAGAENIAESLVAQRAASAAPVGPVTSAHEIDTAFTEGSARLARLVQDRVYGEVARGNSAALDAGVKRETLFVLTRSFVPGALVELTCLSNPAEAEKLASEDYRTALAAALADAVRDYRRSVRQRPPGELDA